MYRQQVFVTTLWQDSYWCKRDKKPFNSRMVNSYLSLVEKSNYVCYNSNPNNSANWYKPKRKWDIPAIKKKNIRKRIRLGIFWQQFFILFKPPGASVDTFRMNDRKRSHFEKDGCPGNSCFS